MIKNKDIWQKLSDTNRPIVLYGMGNGAELVLRQLQKIGKTPVGIFASDAFVRGQLFCEYTVQTYAALAAQFPDMIILVCFGSARVEVLENIEKLSKTHTLLCPDVPVYGESVFTVDFAKKHADQLRAVYDLLCDDLSKETFKAIIEFKLDGDWQKLRLCETEGDTFASLSLGNDEIYLDLGAYRGDTIDQFLARVDTYKQIIAVEPNPKTYSKLADYLKNIHNAQAVCGAVSDHIGTERIHFAGRGTTVAKKGTETKIFTVDSLLNGQPVSLIKMDVEGQEAAALFGARQTILKYRPKIVAAAYHRSEDIFSLPLYVHKLNGDYQIMLRHFRHNLAWDTNFYFV